MSSTTGFLISILFLTNLTSSEISVASFRCVETNVIDSFSKLSEIAKLSINNGLALVVEKAEKAKMIITEIAKILFSDTPNFIIKFRNFLH